MKLNSVTITSEASAQYQKACVSFTVQPDDGSNSLSQQEIDSIENLTVKESIKVLNGILPNIPQNQIQTRTQQVPNYQQGPQFEAPSQNSYVPAYQPKPVSEGQLRFLQQLGYQGDTSSMTSKQAYDLINQLKSRR